MNEMAKFLMVIGGVLIVAGGVLFLLGKIPGVGRLPGDIYIKKENFTLYFPVATSLLLSVIVSLILYFFNRR
jgi:hypothetical protein